MGERPEHWTATEHVIADMYEAGMSFAEIREGLRLAAQQAAKIIIDDMHADDERKARSVPPNQPGDS